MIKSLIFAAALALSAVPAAAASPPDTQAITADEIGARAEVCNNG